jgi:hypothetical protein
MNEDEVLRQKDGLRGDSPWMKWDVVWREFYWTESGKNAKEIVTKHHTSLPRTSAKPAKSSQKLDSDDEVYFP